MKCVVLQPSYIPWRGYFHQIAKADTFIFYDDVQYDKHGWRNRNRIKTANGSIWLTIPVISHGNTTNHTLINEIKIKSDENWRKKHLLSVRYAYSKSPYFSQVFPFVENLYESETDSLSEFTIKTTVKIAEFLGIENTKFLRSSEIAVEGSKTDRLLQILTKVGADHYISGPAAKSYLVESEFESAGIRLEYVDYSFPEYQQLHPPFDSQVSIIDLLFMCGKNAKKYCS
jgi:WbqC-like protein family